jgi:hypothetical protein
VVLPEQRSVLDRVAGGLGVCYLEGDGLECSGTLLVVLVLVLVLLLLLLKVHVERIGSRKGAHGRVVHGV